MKQQIANILFILSGILWSIELLPQLWKTYKTKKVEDISIFFPLICSIAYIVFIIGAFLIKQWYLIIAHVFPFCLMLIMLSLILKYKRR